MLDARRVLDGSRMSDARRVLDARRVSDATRVLDARWMLEKGVRCQEGFKEGC